VRSFTNIDRILNHFTEHQVRYRTEINERVQYCKRMLNQDEIAIWVKLRDEYNSVIENRPVCIDRLNLQFPRLNRSDIIELDASFESLKILRLKMKSLQQHHKRNVDIHISETRGVFTKVQEIYITEEENTRSLESQMKRTIERHEKLVHLRQTRILELSEHEEREKNMQQKIETEKKRIADSINAQRLKTRDKISLFQKEREENEKEEEEQHQQYAKDIRAQNDLGEYYRLERIAFRHSRETEKCQFAQEKQEKAQIALKQRTDRLAALRATVSINMEVDWERILSETESFVNSRKKTTHDGRKDFAPCGLSDKSVMKDPRAKLARTLQEKGLMGSSYARDMIGALQRPSVAHTSSTFKIE
jgi:hypothetical protein